MQDLQKHAFWASLNDNYDEILGTLGEMTRRELFEVTQASERLIILADDELRRREEKNWHGGLTSQRP